MPDDILVCFALPEEARPFRRRLRADPRTRILVTGMGQVNARSRLAAVLAESRPTLLFTCGFAGALAPDLRLGEVVFATDAGFPRRERLAALARPVRFHCAERIAVTAAEKAALRATTGADAVEMESGAIHARCTADGIPCATLRVISDTAAEDLPFDFNALSRADRSLDLPRLLLALAKSPARLPALLRLQRHAARAASRLADALVEITRDRP